MTSPSRSTLILFLAFAATCTAFPQPLDAADPEPFQPVSPGSASSVLPVASGCPSFSWGASESPERFQIVVWTVDDGGRERPEPVIRTSVPGSARSWTPSALDCLTAGRDYAWAVRGVDSGGETEWSEPLLFSTSAPHRLGPAGRGEGHRETTVFSSGLAGTGPNPVGLTPTSAASAQETPPAGLPVASGFPDLSSFDRGLQSKLSDEVGDTVAVEGHSRSPTGYGVVGINDNGGIGVAGFGSTGVLSSGAFGLVVSEATDDGVVVEKAGTPLKITPPAVPGSVGLQVNGAEDAGLYVGYAGSLGAVVLESGGDGFRVGAAADHGLLVDSARVGVGIASVPDEGLKIDFAGGDAVKVTSTDADGLHITSATFDGVEVETAGGHGLRVGSAFIGLKIEDFSDVGIEVAGLETDQSAVFSGVITAHDIIADNDVLISGTLIKASGSFRIDHPLDPANRYLSHSFVESPDMMNVYNGNVVLDGEGQATVELPDWFEALNRSFRYQLTAIGGPAPQLHVATEVAGNYFTIAGGGPGQRVSWQLTGVRRDAYAESNRIPVEIDKAPDERGYYLNPAAFGLPPERGITALRRARRGVSPDSGVAPGKPAHVASRPSSPTER